MLRNLSKYRQLLRNNKSEEYRLINGARRMMSESSEEQMSENYLKFKKKYSAHVESYSQKMKQMELDMSKKVEKSNRIGQVGYTHPYHNDHHPLNFSGVKTSELFFDWIGPE